MSNVGQAVLDVVGLVLSIYTESPYPLLIAEAAGQVLFPTQLPGVTGPRLTDHVTTTASLGDPIPFGWGSFTVNGTVIWLDIVIEHSQTTTQGGKGGPTQDVTTYSYTQSIAIGLHYGEIIDLLRVWENGELVYDKRPQQDGESLTDYNKRYVKSSQYATTFVLYYGTEEQEIDPTIELKEGLGNVPPFLGLAYIVYPDRLLRDDQAQRHPSFKFELVTAATYQQRAIPPVYSMGTRTDLIQGNIIATDWARGRYYIWNASYGEAGDPSATIIGMNIANNTEFASVRTSLGVLLGGTGLAVSPDGAVLFTYFYDGDHAIIERYDGATLTLEGSLGYPVFDVDWQQYAPVTVPDGFGGTAYLIATVSIFYHVSILNCVTLVSTTIATYSYAQLCSSPNEGSTGVWWVLANTPLLFGSGGDISIHKMTSAGGNAVTHTIVPHDIDPTWDRIFEFGDLIRNPSDGNLLFSVNGGLASGGSTNSWYVKINPVTGVIAWKTSSLHVFNWVYGVNQSVISGSTWYLLDGVGGMGYLTVNTSTGVVTVDGASFVGPQYNSSVTNAAVGALISEQVPNPWPGFTVWLLRDAVGGDVLVRDIVESICNQSTLTENDVTTMDDTRIHGYVIQTPSVTGRSAITPLRSVAFFDAVEHGESLRFVTRGAAPVVTLTNADLGAYESETTDDPDANNTSVDTLESDLPMQIRVNYSSVERSYESGEQLSPARYDTDASQVSDIQLPLCLNDAQAAKVAEILWNQAWQRRKTYSFTLDVSKTYLEATDAVLVPLKNTLIRAMITQIDDSSQILRKVTAVSDDDGLYVSSAVAQPAPPQVTMTFYSETSLQLIDSPLLRDRDDTARVTAPLYSAVEPTGTDVWRGAQIYDSTDGTTFTGVTGATNKAAMGHATTALPVVTRPFVTDTTNSLTIQFDDGATLPSSVTTDEVLAGANAMALIDADGRLELLCFRDVATVSGQTVTVSYLLRGRRGTDTMTGGHDIGSRVVMLTTTGLQVTDLDLSNLDVTMYWKAVTFNTALADATSVMFESLGRSLMPYAPVNLTAVLTGSPDPDIDVYAKRRARIGASEWFDGETDDLPLAEDFERYEMDVYSGSSVVRTVSSSSLPVVYPNADVILDFGSVPDSLKAALYQISHQVGRGFAYIVNIPVDAGVEGSIVSVPPVLTRTGTPTFSPGSSTFTPTVSVTISADVGATIYYTTDGSTPTTASAVYVSPITLSISGAVKAFATLSGYLDSYVGIATYTLAGSGSTPNAVENFRLVNQGGPTNNASRAGGSVDNIQVLYCELPIGGPTADTLILTRSKNGAAAVDRLTQPITSATRYVFVDSTATNSYNASNIGEDGGSPVTEGPTDVYVYQILAAVGGSGGVRGAPPASCKFMFYEGDDLPAWVSGGTYLVGDKRANGGNNFYCMVAVTGSSTAPGSDSTHWEQMTGGLVCNGPSFDLSFGLTSNDFAHARTGGTEDLAVASGAGAGLQPAADSPLTWVFGAEIGAFCQPYANGVFTITLTPSRTGMALNFAILTRGPPGDVFPHKVVNLLSYGPATVAGVPGTYNVPLGDLMLGVSTGTASITSGVMAYTHGTGPGVDAVSWVTGPNITTSTWISATPAQNGSGNYTVTGQVNAANAAVTIHRTSFYKFQVVMTNANPGDSIKCDKWGVRR